MSEQNFDRGARSTSPTSLLLESDFVKGVQYGWGNEAYKQALRAESDKRVEQYRINLERRLGMIPAEE